MRENEEILVQDALFGVAQHINDTPSGCRAQVPISLMPIVLVLLYVV